jgi:hypothetical protein
MAKRCKEVIIDGQRRIIIDPEKGKEYRLGYHGNFPHPRSVEGVYWGYAKRRPLFLSLREDGKVEIYRSRTLKCFLTFYSDGDDGPDEDAIKVYFDGVMPAGPERDAAAERLLQIKQARKREFEASLAQMLRR